MNQSIQEMVEADRKAIASKRADLSIWALDFSSDAAAVQAFMNQAAQCEDFDYQFSQFVRRYFLKRHDVYAGG